MASARWLPVLVAVAVKQLRRLSSTPWWLQGGIQLTFVLTVAHMTSVIYANCN